MQGSIGVLLVDDHKIVREGLRTLLEKEPDIKVIGEAESGERALELIRELSPNVVVMDINMPGLGGVEATQQLLAIKPEAKVVALSMFLDKHFIGGMLKAGASGYLLKDCAYVELVHAIRTVTANAFYLSPKIAGIVAEGYVNHLEVRDHSAPPVLTKRELEVLLLVAEGKTAKEAAVGLGLSVKTVQRHRQQIMKKLNVHKASELVKYAIREKLIELNK